MFATREYFRAFGSSFFPPNSYVFFAIPQMYVATDKNKIYSHVLGAFLRGLLRIHANKLVTNINRKTKFVNKPLITDLSVRPI